MQEEGAVGASEDTSLGAGAWDGGGRFSWQGGGGIDGWGPTATRRCGGVAVVAAGLRHGQC